MDYRTIISVSDLHHRLTDPEVVIFDCRHELMNPDAGARAYAEAHLPGARFAHSETDLAGPRTGRNGRHPLPEPEAFKAWLGRNGVDSSKQVVAYDFAAGSASARLWWLLRWVGHARVDLLDARAPERFKGLSEPMDPVAGHIPGALNRLFKENLTVEGRFKPPHELSQ